MRFKPQYGEFPLARAHFQGLLFTVAPTFAVKTVGDARVAFGNVAEEIVCAALGLNRIKIDGRCPINFDAELDGTFFEIKSCKARSGKVIAYEWRMQKESNYPGLMYAVLMHNATGERGDILNAVLSDCSILLIPAERIRSVATGYPLNFHKKKASHSKRCGYTREGYIDGYRNVPIKHLLQFVRYRLNLSLDLYGRTEEVKVLIC